MDAQQPEEEVEDDCDSSDNDSDYEYLGGDVALYDSALDGADELLFVKDSLERISMMNDGGMYFQMLMSGMTEPERDRFSQVMQNTLGIKDREQKITHLLEKTAHETKMKKRAVINGQHPLNIAMPSSC